MRIQSVVGVSVALSFVIGLASCPAQMFIYPLQGQSPEKQEFDQFTYYKWAKEQTGFDPNQQAAATSAPKHRRGGMLGEAMGGSRTASDRKSDCGRCRKGRGYWCRGWCWSRSVGTKSGKCRIKKKQQQASSQNQQNSQIFNRAYGVCRREWG